jgi:hypothetical protein
MNEPKESDRVDNEVENSTSLNDNEDIRLNVVDDKSKIENNLNIINNEANKDEDSDESNIQNDSISSFSPNISKIVIKEKPKVIRKRDDDNIEEFDTDDEDEDQNKQNSVDQNYSDHISYEGNKCIYTEPGTGRKLIWNSKENKWCT